jgi:hypothetical protein
VDLGVWLPALFATEAPRLILLDTNALLWLHQGHSRVRPLGRLAGRLYLSPASILEVRSSSKPVA